jgi:hypothetical protein
MRYEIFNIGLDPIKNYSSKVTNRVDYFGCFCPEQVLIEEDIDIY